LRWWIVDFDEFIGRPPGPRVRNSLIRIWPAAGSTVIVAGLLVTLLLPLVAEALISAEPVARPVSVPVAEPLPEVALTESTIAMLLSFEANETVTPPIVWPN